MKKTYAVFIAFLCTLATFQAAFCQRNCSTHDIHQQLLEENPTYRSKRDAIEKQAKNYILQRNEARMSVTIPVVVHVLWRTNSPIENISDEQIKSQIDVLNQDFRRLNPDAGATPGTFQPIAADCDINFCLAQRTPQGTATTGINRVSSTRQSTWGTDDSVKDPSKGGVSPWNPQKYLNIYVCNIGGGILGYSLFPGAPEEVDAIVVDFRYMGTKGTVSYPYNKGRTATHEVGHWLNLYHIWGDSHCGDDEVSDTPLHSESNKGCPTFPKYSACNQSVEMTSNYMDYTDDGCMNMFSQGQKARMQALFAVGGERNGLLTSLGCLPVSDAATCNTTFSYTLQNLTEDEISMRWANSANINFSFYSVKYKKISETIWTIANSSSPAITISSLDPSTKYELKLVATCSNGTSVESQIYPFTTPSSLSCGTPLDLKMVSVGSNAAKISWTAVTGATSYLISYKPSSASTWIGNGSTTPYIYLAELSANTAYDVKVIAFCNGIIGTESTILKFTTTAAQSSCLAPTSVSINSITTNTAKIVWTSVTGASSYLISFKLKTASTWITNDNATNTFTLYGLTAGAAYDVKVSTKCNGVNSTSSEMVGFTTTAASNCATPNNVSVSNISIVSAKITWAAVTGVTAFKVNYRVSGTTTWKSMIVTSTASTLSNLVANTKYDIEVASMCSGTTSIPSSIQIFSTLASSTCGTPTGLTVTSLSNTSAKITWSAVIGAKTYIVQYRKQGTLSWQKVSNITTSYYTFANLTLSTSYEVQVSTNCTNGGLSPYSGIKSFTTLNAITVGCLDKYESNNTRITAKVIPTTSSIYASIGSAGDEDWFKFSNSTTQRNIQVILAGVTNAYEIKLYNSTGLLVATSNNFASNGKSVYFNNGAVGSYYAQVYANNNVFNANTCYTLRAQLSINAFFRKNTSENDEDATIIEEKSDFDFRLQPNPTQYESTIYFEGIEKPSEINIHIVDLTGKIIARKEEIISPEKNYYTFDVSQYQSGIYMIQAKTANFSQTKKLVVQRN